MGRAEVRLLHLRATILHLQLLLFCNDNGLVARFLVDLIDVPLSLSCQEPTNVLRITALRRVLNGERDLLVLREQLVQEEALTQRKATHGVSALGLVDELTLLVEANIVVADVGGTLELQARADLLLRQPLGHHVIANTNSSL